VWTEFAKWTAIGLLIGAAGCSSTPRNAEKKAPEKPPEAVGGQYALHQMYTVARSWAPDAQVWSLRSLQLEEVKADPGKAGAWQAMFVTTSGNRARSYTYSVIESEGNLHKGTFALNEESWSGARGKQRPFVMAAVKVDSTAAYETASKKATEYSKKNPGMPINFQLDAGEFPNPSWRVIWGASVGTSNFSIYVDASTGDYLKTMR
jgi:hypothetical protein